MGIEVEEIEDGVFQVSVCGTDYDVFDKLSKGMDIQSEGLLLYWLMLGVKVGAWLETMD